MLVVDTFGGQLFDELDYRQEARNAARFQALYGAIPNVKVPRVYPALGSERVLAMEWIDGEKGPWVVKGGQGGKAVKSAQSSSSRGGAGLGGGGPGGTGGPVDRDEALRMLAIGLQCSVRQVLRSGFFHAGATHTNQGPGTRLGVVFIRKK